MSTQHPTPPRPDMVPCPHCGTPNDPQRGSTRCRDCGLPLGMAAPLCTQQEAFARAAHVLARARAHQGTLTAEQAAREAYRPGGPTVPELTARIRRLRAQSHRAAA